jgi:hypothetical protein
MLWGSGVILISIICVWMCLRAYSRWYQPPLGAKPASENLEQDCYFYAMLAAVAVLFCYLAKLDLISLRFLPNWAATIVATMMLVLGTGGIFLFTFIMVCIRFWQFCGRLPWWQWLVTIVAMVAFTILLAFCPLALVLAAVVFLVLAVAALLVKPRLTLLLLVTLAAPLIAVVVVLPRTIVQLWGGVNSSLLFELLRVTDLPSGVSPFVAVCCLTVILMYWGYIQLKRRGLEDHFSMPNPLPDKGTTAFESISRGDVSLKNAVNTPLEEMRSNRWLFLLLCFLLFVVFLRIGWRLVPSFEGRAFDCFFLAGFGLAVVLVVFSIMHFLLLWNRVSKLLRS